ncbi:MAG TPA: hypothetical protein DDX40_02285 [Rikenellaceae bacterium]|nr:hypothetical protein [Rikenellaceae bacterium]
MTKGLTNIICVAVMLIITSACEKYEPDWDIFEAHGVAEAIKTDFYERYSKAVKVTNAMTYYNKSQIEFVDTDGLKCTAVYKGHSWMMTQKEYDKNGFAFLKQLPERIAKAYLGAGLNKEYYEWDQSYVIEVARRGFDKKAYEFQFVVFDENITSVLAYRDYSVLIDEDGELLDILLSHSNRSIWWYDMSSCVYFVRQKYPKATILAGINNAGDNILYIKDNGILKAVRFDYNGSDEQTWSATIEIGKNGDEYISEYSRKFLNS